MFAQIINQFNLQVVVRCTLTAFVFIFIIQNKLNGQLKKATEKIELTRCDTLGTPFGKKSLYFAGKRADGFLTGQNTHRPRYFAQYFSYDGRATHLQSVLYDFAYANSAKPDSGFVYFHLWQCEPFSDEPDVLLATRKLPLRTVMTRALQKQPVSVIFDLKLPPDKRFYAGYETRYNGRDSLALWSETLGEGAKNGAWMKLDTAWYPLANAIENRPNANLAIFPVVGAPPEAAFSVSSDGRCTGIPITFYQEARNHTRIKWVFYGGAPGQSVAANPTVTYSKPGTYTVKMIAYGFCDQADTLIRKYVVSNPPKVDAGSELTLCYGGEGQLGSPLNAPTLSYRWEPARFCVDPNNPFPTVIPYQTTTFTLTATDSTGYRATDTVRVNVTGDRKSVFLSVRTDSLVCTKANLYFWYLNDSLVYQSKQPVYRPKKSGNYQVLATLDGNCRVRSNQVTFIRFLADSTDKKKCEIDVYKPLNADSLVIRFDLPSSAVVGATLYDQKGRQLWQEKLGLRALFGKSYINLKNYEAGRYRLKITIGKAVFERNVWINEQD